MQLNLIADKIIKRRIYPALAQHEARPYTPSWREFGQHWPYTIPLRIQEYCDHHAVELNLLTSAQAWPENAFYPIGIGFFDFSIDYFDLLPDPIKLALQQCRIRILFYYHEGDNPARIKRRIDALIQQHGYHHNCYVFVSANSSAASIPGFVFFNDFELWYWQRNHLVPATSIHSHPRSHEFTVLNRLHKTWRATVMADLKRSNLLENSYWSYCESGAIGDDNPIEIDRISQLRYSTGKFLEQAPYYSDQLSQQQRNDHSQTPEYYHSDAYCNIVIETHFDADQSGGTFLTEKTFKPIKHGQLFFIAGPAGSLQALRKLGYRTFDHLLDNSYDQIADNTQRWQKLLGSIKQAQSQLPELYKRAQNDIRYNQQLFLQPKTERLNTLIRNIYEQCR